MLDIAQRELAGREKMVGMNMIQLLCTPDGRRLLESLPPYSADETFSLTARLRAEGFDPELVAAALTQARLRARAAAKFGDFAQAMLFTHDGVEQATRLNVAAHHGARFRNAGVAHVVDVGCGIGADSMGFSGLGLRVSSIEQDEDTAVAASHNLAPFPEARVIHEDARNLTLSDLGADALWLDPARRSGGKRIVDPEEWSPPFSLALELAEEFSAAGIKVAPGIDYSHLPDDSHVQWTSVDGELVEAVVWRGKAAPVPGRSALVIAGGVAKVFVTTTQPPCTPSEQVEPRDLGAYLYEPNAAVIRSGGIARLCAEHDLAPVSRNIAYLTGDEPIDSALLASFAIDAVLPLDLKKVRAYLASQGVGIVEIKKRGTDLDPALWRKKLKLNPKHKKSAVLIATPVNGKHQMLVAHR